MNAPFSHRRRAPAGGTRTGVTLIETVVAAAILSILFSVMARFLVRLREVDASAEQRQIALRTVENLMERGVAGVRRTGALPALALPPEVLERLRDGQLAVDIGPRDAAGFAAVTLKLSWTNRAGARTEPVGLTAWMPLASAGTEVAP